MPFPNGTVKRRLSRDLGGHVTIRDFGPHDYKSTDTDEYPIGNNAGLTLGDAFGGSLAMALARYTPAELGVTATLADTVDWAAAQLMARKCKHGHIQAGMQCKFSQPLILGSHFTLEGEQDAELISNVDLDKILQISSNSSYVRCKLLKLTGPGGPPTTSFGPEGVGIWVQDGCSHIYLDDLECTAYQQAGIYIDSAANLYIDKGHFHDGYVTVNGTSDSGTCKTSNSGNTVTSTAGTPFTPGMVNLRIVLDYTFHSDNTIASYISPTQITVLNPPGNFNGLTYHVVTFLDQRSGADVLVRHQLNNSSVKNCYMESANDFGFKLLPSGKNDTAVTSSSGHTVTIAGPGYFNPFMLNGNGKIIVNNAYLDVASFVSATQITTIQDPGDHPSAAITALNIYDSSDVLLDNLRIKDKHFYGWTFYAADGGIHDCQVVNTNAYNGNSRNPEGLEFGSGYGMGGYIANYCRHILVADCRMEKCVQNNDGTSLGRGALSVSGACQYIDLVNLQIELSGVHGIDVRASGPDGTGTRVIGGRAVDCAQFGLYSGSANYTEVKDFGVKGGVGGMVFADSKKYKISNSTIYGVTGIGFYSDPNCHDFDIDGLDVELSGNHGVLLSGQSNGVRATRLKLIDNGTSAPGTLSGITAQGSGGMHWLITASQSYNEAGSNQGYGYRFFPGISDFNFDVLTNQGWLNVIKDYDIPLFPTSTPLPVKADHFSIFSNGTNWYVSTNGSQPVLTSITNTTSQSVTLISVNPGRIVLVGSAIYTQSRWVGTGVTSLTFQIQDQAGGRIYTAPLDMLTAGTSQENAGLQHGFVDLTQLGFLVTCNTPMQGKGITGIMELYLFNAQVA